jgi:hypothetical protein
MYDKLRLDIQPSRYGFIVVPYVMQARFNYNRVYSTINDVIQDFNLNGFDFNGIIDGYYEFKRRESL